MKNILKWPVDTAAKRYKKHYHIRYIHAKKLFVFDALLLLSTLLLIASSAFWFLYDPTVTDLVHINISASQDRIQSGEHVSYTFTYQNKSDVTLKNPILTLSLPPGFLLTEISPSQSFNGQTQDFTLPALNPNASGQVNITGWFYGTVGEEYPLTASLTYTQEGRNTNETKRATTYAKLPDSVLKITPTQIPKKILSEGETPISFSITNTGKQPLANIVIPLQNENKTLRIDVENNSNATWSKETLTPNETVIIEGTLVSTIAERITETTLSITASLAIEHNTFIQKPFSQQLNVLYPHIVANTSWKEQYVEPGKKAHLQITLTNDGTSDLEQVSLSFPINTELIDVSRLTSGTYRNGIVTINAAQNENVRTISQGEQKQVDIALPIRTFISSGTDRTLSPTVSISAKIPDLPESTYKTQTVSTAIPIGTLVSMNAELRYYTTEGDQLGRGPLPPIVGKQTKYWALITLKNTTSRIENPKVTATLPSYVEWTGRTSVSHGADVSFNPSNKSLYWTAPSLLPHEKAGIYIELGMTPKAKQIGQTPVMLENIQFSATDAFTNQTLQTQVFPIDISIPNDSIGKAKGTTISD